MLMRLRNESVPGTNCTSLVYIFFVKRTITTIYDESKVSKFNGLISVICLYLRKLDSALYPYNCSGFLSGCPNTSYMSNKLFESKHHTLKRFNHSFCNIYIYIYIYTWNRFLKI